MGKNRKPKPYEPERSNYSLDLYNYYSTNKSPPAVITVRMSAFNTHNTTSEFWPELYKRGSHKWSNTIQPHRESRLSSVWKIIDGYLDNSTLHGLRYVGDSTISYKERFIWLVTFVCAVICAVYCITNIYAKFKLNSVVIVINPSPTPVQEIPFPAVTVCNMNVIRKNESNIRNRYFNNESMLDLACEFNNPLFSSSDIDNRSDVWQVTNFISKVSQPCDKMLTVCKWLQQDINCNQIFNPTVTDQGLCCTFNQLPLENILRNMETMVKFNSNSTNDHQVDDWNPERGYSLNASYEVFPFRSRGPGAHLGLFVVMDTDLNSYYCSSTSSAGIKVLLHNPAEMPIMEPSAFMVPPGLAIRAVFKPVINDATINLKSTDILIRQCYFTEERYLKYFRTYTKANCKVECLANITLERCGCTLYYLPRSESTKICGKMELDCTDDVRDMMQVDQTTSREEKLCNCLPACFQLSYEKSMSYGLFSDSFKVNKEFTKNASQKYFVKNMVSFQLYFVATGFSKFTKSNLFGFSDFLSNIGGILGLFLGFGTLSIVEICYHFTLKWICSNYRLQKRNLTKKNIVKK